MSCSDSKRYGSVTNRPGLESAPENHGRERGTYWALARELPEQIFIL